LYNDECKKYELNTVCEDRILKLYNYIECNSIIDTNIREQYTDIGSFTDIIPHLLEHHFGPKIVPKNNNDIAPVVVLDKTVLKGMSKYKKPTVEQLKAFIQVRTEVTSYKGRSPLYTSLTKVGKNKLIDLAIESSSRPLQPRIFRKPRIVIPLVTQDEDE